MTKPTPTLLALALALALAPAAARAEAFTLTFAQSAYTDGKDGALNAPEGVACNDAGAVVVADTGNARLVRYALKDRELGPAGEVKAPQLVAPVRVHLDSKGNALVLDRKGSRIVRFDAAGKYLGAVEAKEGPPLAPDAFDVDAGDRVWVLDGASRRLVVLDPAGAVVRSIDLPKEGRLFTDVAVDSAGVAYAVDAAEGVVWAADPGATAFRRLTRSLREEMSFAGAIAAVQGKLLVVDQVGHGIVVLGRDGTFLGRQLSLGASEGLVSYPGQLCVTSAGDAFVADRGNSRLDQYSAAR